MWPSLPPQSQRALGWAICYLAPSNLAQHVAVTLGYGPTSWPSPDSLLALFQGCFSLLSCMI